MCLDEHGDSEEDDDDDDDDDEDDEDEEQPRLRSSGSGKQIEWTCGSLALGECQSTVGGPKMDQNGPLQAKRDQNGPLWSILVSRMPKSGSE